MYGRHNFAGERNPNFGKFGDKSPTWRGGRKVRKDGYILLYAPEHPYNNDGYVLEHRLIMERTLKRYLTPEEVVHHIDGNPLNNSPKNRSVVTKLFNERH